MEQLKTLQFNRVEDIVNFILDTKIGYKYNFELNMHPKTFKEYVRPFYQRYSSKNKHILYDEENSRGAIEKGIMGYLYRDDDEKLFIAVKLSMAYDIGVFVLNPPILQSI